MPYLKRLEDGVLVPAQMKGIAPHRKEPAWMFDWSKPVREGETVLALMADGQEQGRMAFHPELENLCYNLSLVEAAYQNNPLRISTGQKAYDDVGPLLFAEVARRSFADGLDGYVVFIAKTKLVSYYSKKLGARLIDSQRMFLNTAASQKLVLKYLGGVQNGRIHPES